MSCAINKHCYRGDNFEIVQPKEKIMRITDKERYNTPTPDVDILPLGSNPALKPINKKIVRHTLSFIEPDSITERERAVRILIKRISDYYEVVGYVGPLMSGSSEIGYSLGGWIQERGFDPYREAFCTTNNYAWKNQERIFNSVRYVCFETALLLAAWEISREVPESAEALKRAAWTARNAIHEHCDRYWPDIRNRMGSRGMHKQLKGVIKKLDSLTLVQGTGWLGHFVAVDEKAA